MEKETKKQVRLLMFIMVAALIGYFILAFWIGRWTAPKVGIGDCGASIQKISL